MSYFRQSDRLCWLKGICYLKMKPILKPSSTPTYKTQNREETWSVFPHFPPNNNQFFSIFLSYSSTEHKQNPVTAEKQFHPSSSSQRKEINFFFLFSLLTIANNHFLTLTQCLEYRWENFSVKEKKLHFIVRLCAINNRRRRKRYSKISIAAD